MQVDGESPLFVISVAAELAGMHPQTLRQYDRMGLVSPKRTRRAPWPCRFASAMRKRWRNSIKRSPSIPTRSKPVISVPVPV